MIPPFSPDGMRQMVAWYAAEWIISSFDAGIAECKARKATDPSYKPDAFADKPKGNNRTAQQALDAVIARARR